MKFGEKSKEREDTCFWWQVGLETPKSDGFCIWVGTLSLRYARTNKQLMPLGLSAATPVAALPSSSRIGSVLLPSVPDNMAATQLLNSQVITWTHKLNKMNSHGFNQSLKCLNIRLKFCPKFSILKMGIWNNGKLVVINEIKWFLV